MKLKINLLLIWLVFTCLNLQSQTYIGFKIGGVLSTFSADEEILDGVELSSKLGISVGSYISFAIGADFAIQPELYFVQKGSKFDDSFDQASFIFNYTELRVIGKYEFGSDDLSGFAFIGPSFGYFLNGKLKDEESGQTEDFDPDDTDFNRTELGLNLGFGINLPLGFADAVVDVGYLYGLSSLNEDPDDGKISNRGININFGLKFPLGTNAKE